MSSQSIEALLSEKFGFDQYQASDHATDNRREVEASDLCGCYFCSETYPSSEVVKWTDEGQSACCPKCGLGNVVIGSASGLPLAKEFLDLVHAHWF